MLERILRKDQLPFGLGRVVAIAGAGANRRVQVELRSGLRIWVLATIDMTVGNDVIIGRNANGHNRFVLQIATGTPSTGTIHVV